ncbi:MAG: zf-HC2 domain-containing protein [Pyrinomonadaceae bacterium]
MMTRDNNNDELIDRTTKAMRSERLDQPIVDSAANRVWSRVASELESTTESLPMFAARPERLSNCADFQSLIPYYLQHDLSPARRLLLEDHTQECIPCRRALKGGAPMFTMRHQS